MASLNKLADEIEKINLANGWYEGHRSFAEDIALIHSEASEALEEFRTGEHSIQGDFVEGLGSVPKPVGIPSELADIIIRVLDTARRYNIDMDKHVRLKLDYNKTRGYRHGGKKV